MIRKLFANCGFVDVDNLSLGMPSRNVTSCALKLVIVSRYFEKSGSRERYVLEYLLFRNSLERTAHCQTSTPDAVARWEESKKWQKMVDRLKSRIADKDQELEKLHKTLEMTKNVLERYVTEGFGIFFNSPDQAACTCLMLNWIR